MAVKRLRFHKAGTNYVSDDYQAFFFRDKAQSNWWHLKHRVPGGFVTLGLIAGGTVAETKRWAEAIVLSTRERWEQESNIEVAAEAQAQEA